MIEKSSMNLVAAGQLWGPKRRGPAWYKYL